MRRSLLLILSLAAAFSVTSCDFCRRLAGRPDSARLEVLRAAKIQDEQQKKQARADSIRAEGIRRERIAAQAKAEADSVAAFDELRKKSVVLRHCSELRIPRASLQYRYYIIIGSFSNSANSRKLIDKCRDAGYEPVLVPFGGGRTSVAAAASDKVSDLVSAFRRVSKENFCPDDRYVLVND